MFVRLSSVYLIQERDEMNVYNCRSQPAQAGKNLERIVLPKDWDEQETARGKMLKQDYMKFEI